jgi:gliding motility-associated-like protein
MNFIPQVKSVLAGLCAILAYQAGLWVGPVSAQVPNYVPQTNLLAWYPFSGNANDLHTTGRNLRIYNSASLTSDRFGVSNRAYSFSPATKDYMETSFPTTYNAYTIAAWVQVDSFYQYSAVPTRGAPAGSNFFAGQVACVGSCSNKVTGIGIGLDDSASRAKAIHYNSSSVKQEQFSSSPGKQWFHIASVWNGNKRYLYINGLAVDSVNMGSVERLETSFIIGAGFHNHVYYFHSGKIDDVGIWSRALNSCEVYGLYKAAVPVPVVSIGNNVQQFCGSDSAQLTATAGFVAYRWNTSANTRSIKAGRSGWFHVTATDSFGCRARDTALVSILNPRILIRDTIICQASSFTLRVKTPATLACPEAPPQFASSLLAWYPFCGNTRDAGTRGHHGTNFGASLSNDRFGRSNNAYSFNGTGDYISVGDPADNSFDLLGKPFTISLWVKTRQTNLGPLVTKQRNNFLNQSGDYNLDLEASTGKARMAMGFGGSGASKVSSTSINNDVWRHVVAVYTKDSIEIYVDGIKNTSGSNAISGPGSLSNSTSSLLFGRGWLNAYFQGQMDDIGLFNRVLTPDEVKFLYQGPVYSWSTADTGTTAVVNGSGRKRVWVKVEDGIGSCSDTTFITFSSPKVNLPSDTIRFTACSRDSMRLGVGTGWKSVLWSNATTDSATWFKTTGRIHVRTEDSFGCFARDTAWFINPGKPKAQITGSDSVNCNGGSDGSLSSSGSGGFLPHSYRWNDPSAQTSATASGLAAGTYRLILRDAYGCADTVQGTVYQPSAVRVSISSTDSVNCKAGNDGSASATASGGSGGYKYRWNDPAAQTTATASGLSAGSFKVILTDHYGCKDSASAVVHEPAKVNLSITATDSVNCLGGSDGSATAFAAGGSGGYKYRWNDPTAQTGATASNLTRGTYRVWVGDHYGCSDSADVQIYEPAGLVASISSSDSARCKGSSDGSATAGASGGSGGYKYRWNDPAAQTTAKATGLSAGTYRVIVSDFHGCTDTAFVNLREPDAVDVRITASDSVNCFGGSDGSARALASGGSGGYTYIWNDPSSQTSATATGLAKGSYRVWATDIYGCKDSADITIHEPARLVLSLTRKDSVNCFGGSDGFAVVKAAGGSGGYRYSWNDPARQTLDSAAGLAAGSYKAYVRDHNGCRDSLNVSILEPARLRVSILSTDSVNCKAGSDGSITAGAGGGSGGYRYRWNDPSAQTTATASGLRAGTYTILLTDVYGCRDSVTGTVAEPAKVSASILSNDSTSCFGSADGKLQAGASGGSGGYRYRWNDPSAQTTATATGLRAGTWKVIVRDVYGCSDSISATIGQPIRIAISLSRNDSVQCAGGRDGRLVVSVSGGRGTYRYNWNDPAAQTTANATGLSAGNYRLIVTDGQGCTDSLKASVGQPDSIRIRIVLTDSVNCYRGSDGRLGVTASGGNGGLRYRWNDPSAQTTATATGLRAGTYRVRVSDMKACADSLNIPLYEPDLMYLSLGMNDSVDCFGGSDGALSALASGGTRPYRYLWNDPSRQTSSTAFGLKAGKYFVRVTDYNGCKDSMEIDLKEPDRVRISMMRIDSVRCFGGSDGSITVIASGGNGLYRYLWNDPAKQTTSTATGLPKGNWKVWAYDQYQCSDSAVFRMDEPDRLRVSITAVDSVRCFSGSDGRIQSAGTGGTLPYSYLWNDPAAQRTPSAINLSRGRYLVRLSDGKGCSDTISRFVAEPTRLLATISFTDSVRCFSGSDGRAMAQAQGGNGGYQYQWNDQFRQTTALASNLFPGVYRVRVTDRKGCRDSVTATVHAPLPMILSIASDSVNCFGGSDGSLQVQVQQGRGPLSFSWTDPARQTGTRASNLRRGTYRVRVTDIRGCRDSMSGTVNEPAQLLAFIVRSDSVNCFGGTDGALEAGGSGGSGGYRWQWNDPAAQRTAIAGNLRPGSYTATLRDFYGCSDTATGTVFQPTPVRISLSGIDSVRCFGGNDGRIHTAASGGSGGYRWRWNDPFGQVVATAMNLRRGTYKAVVRDIYGCSDSLQASVAEPERLDVAITRVDQIACFGGSDGALYSSATGGVPPITWLWNDPAAQRTPDALGLRQGRYLVTVRDSKGCTDTASALVREPAPLRIRITQTFPVSCYRLSDAAANTVTSGGTTPYSWNWNSNPPQFTANASNLPAGQYRVVVRDFRGCSDSAEVKFDEPDPITVQIRGNRLTMYGMVHDLEAEVFPAGRYTYNWTPGTVFGPGNGNSERPRGIFTESGTVKVTARNSKGCEGEDTAYFTVVLLPEDIMPTAFTPNTDNLNEGFGMPSIFDVEEFTIYDRWGAIVFRASPNQQRWDGRTASGEQVPGGSYTYRLRARLKGTQQYVTHTGKVSLIR